MKINFTDNSKEILYKFAKARERGLKAIGMTAEGYAKKELNKKQKHAKGPDRPYIDTGRLRNSITYATLTTQGTSFSYTDDNGKKYDDVRGKGADGDSVYIGTNVEYAP